MINYYKSKMDMAYKQWKINLETENIKTAEVNMRDYLNYKEMYESRKEIVEGK